MGNIMIILISKNIAKTIKTTTNNDNNVLVVLMEVFV
jgi:hypothetical protein